MKSSVRTQDTPEHPASRSEADPKGNKPTLTVYAVKERGGEQKSIWTRIGAAWPHQNGPGFAIRLDALPIDSRVVLLDANQAAPINQA